MLGLTNQFAHEFSEVIEGHTGNYLSGPELKKNFKLYSLSRPE